MEKEQLTFSEKFKDLKPYQQETVARFLDNFCAINALNVSSISSEGMVCRKCGEKSFVKNGNTKGIQRYQCRSCKSTQFHDANTPLYNMKIKGKWADFVFLMLDTDRSKTVKSVSDELDINPKTAYRWRHKFLSSLNAVNSIVLLEESEIDEVYFPFTVKGIIGKEKFDVYKAPDHPDNVESAFRIEEKKI
jgi:transposase-like protein